MREKPTETLPEKALPLFRLQAAIQCIITALVPIGYGVLLYFFSFPFWILWILIATWMIHMIFTVIVFPPIKWKRWSYEVLGEEIDLQYGVIIMKRTLVPMARVQHVDTVQGPLLKKYQLSAVTISTAATVHTIPALSQEVADHLRDQIAALAAVAKDD
ncbi:PH domain-containing protein [Alkalihalobacillus hemicellulosilyticus]|uniref:YdbS-like PH domain-containing protein n=1 Tax=Halalkalibacter hemicellulosilyticusJCM 9152 TaxID=1236971 RepID=W4QAK2_9BACI|nr:PH domain-containing protein [Halalkalibacter hemicellulosilyticus]GAE29081.1 hypothetical protein JCM9152_420 [Halalkalibacter hemicellulosilyticusJCM 9152]